VTGIFHIVLARKPLEGTIAENCLQWGCGALWIDGTRVASVGPHGSRGRRKFDGFNEGEEGKFLAGPLHSSKSPENPAGRFPANLILGGEEVTMGFPLTGLSTGGKTGAVGSGGRYNGGWNGTNPGISAGGFGDSGTASRFFFNFSEQEADE
jgi:site-specific DNA-methyltransferase (adenine-specific)